MRTLIVWIAHAGFAACTSSQFEVCFSPLLFDPRLFSLLLLTPFLGSFLILLLFQSLCGLLSLSFRFLVSLAFVFCSFGHSLSCLSFLFLFLRSLRGLFGPLLVR